MSAFKVLMYQQFEDVLPGDTIVVIEPDVNNWDSYGGMCVRKVLVHHITKTGDVEWTVTDYDNISTAFSRGHEDDLVIVRSAR